MTNTHTFPHLSQTTKELLTHLQTHLLKNQTVIETWFRQEWHKTPAPITVSVDLRNAGFKCAPVDTNLFPAGFNNLNQSLLPLAIQAIQSVLGERYPGCQRVLLIPESHTQHPYYYQNLSILYHILLKAGFDTRIGSLIEGLKETKQLTIDENTSITLTPVQRNGDHLTIDGFDPCLILLNNDLSGGIPDVLNNIKQTIIPSLNMGWSQRSKISHFDHYAQVSNAFAKHIGIDPWIIQPSFTHCDDIDFVTREGEDNLIQKTRTLFEKIHKKYDEYGIKQSPFVVIKADQGTYGMGVLMIKHPDEIAQLNRKQRKSMTFTKGKQKINRVIIQEGVYTFETCGENNEAVAEPVVYLLGQHVIGGFYRIHTERGKDENLNAPGMQFEPLAFCESCNNPDIEHCAKVDDHANRLYTYGVIARLAALAAAREMAAT